MRSDDLAPLLAPTPPPAGNVRSGAGTVVSWNPLDATNVIRYNGTDLVNLPTIASSTEVLQIKPGDVVRLDFIGGGGFSTVQIVGRITTPGTPQAASFMDLFGFESATENTEGAALSAYTNLGDLESPANPGPSVTIDVGRTGRVLVLVQAEILSSRGTVGFGGGNVGIQLSGANTATANDQIGFAWVKYQDHTTTAFESWMGTGSHLYTGLNSGSTVFTLKYGRRAGDPDTKMKNRTVMALPL